jgi:hypothetical protein
VVGLLGAHWVLRLAVPLRFRALSTEPKPLKLRILADWCASCACREGILSPLL